MTNNEYHANKNYINCSSLKHFLKSPAHYKYAIENPTEQTPQMLLGSLIHCLILEPEKFNSEYVVFNPELRPEKDKTMASTKNKQFLAEFNEINNDKTVIDIETYQNAILIQNAVKTHKTASKIFEGIGENEKCLFSENFNGAKVKIKPDRIKGDYIIDLKTCTDASTEGFTKQILKYNYDFQAAFYIDVESAIMETPPKKFIIVAVETSAPYLVNIFELGESFICKGRYEYTTCLQKFLECEITGDYQGYNSFSNEEIVLLNEVPSWAYKTLNY